MLPSKQQENMLNLNCQDGGKERGEEEGWDGEGRGGKERGEEEGRNGTEADDGKRLTLLNF